MRVLFVNHTSRWSGAEVALLRLLDGLRDMADAVVACPAPGRLADELDALGVRRVRIPPNELSFRPHPIRTPQGLAQTVVAGVRVRAAARRHRADVIHANTVRAGLICAVAARLGSPPVLVQVHEHLPLSRLGRATRAVIAGTASGIAAVTDYTAADFDRGLRRPRARRVYVSVDLERFDPERVGPAPLREELGLDGDAVLIGQVSQITPWKGQDTAIRMLAGVAAQRPEVHLVLAGAIAFRTTTRYDNEAYLASLHALVDELGLQGRVHFLGQRDDVPAILRACTLTVLPSWDEPFGLAAIESMAMGTPPMITEVGGAREFVADGLCGRVLPPTRSEVWTAAALDLLADRDRLARMGREARRVATGFSSAHYAEQMLDAYREAIGPARAPSSAMVVSRPS